MKQLIIRTMNNVNSVSFYAQARNAFAGFFWLCLFLFLLFYPDNPEKPDKTSGLLSTSN